MSNSNAKLRTMVRGAYDMQKLRIQMGNRIAINFLAKLGQEPGKPQSELTTEAATILKDLKASFKKLTDGVKTFPRQRTFKGDKVISDYTELCLIAQYLDIERNEKEHFGRLGNVLKTFPVWTQFLEGVKGCGPAMAGVIISEFDIYKAPHPSSFWRYAGLDVAEDGQGRSRKKEHLVDVQYVDKDGKDATRKGITFNPFLKTKLMGVLTGCFIKADNDPYAQIYRDYKHRMENHAKYGAEDVSKGHRHNMAMRYMMKQFLVELHMAWRAIEGLPVSKPYAEAKLGLKHQEDGA